MQPETQLTKPIRPTKPPGYSFLSRRCTKDERLRVRRYLSGCREGLVSDLGGEQALTAAQIILIDRLISLLGVIRGIESYHAESILTDSGELRPSLGKNYLSYVNSCRLILVNLGLERVGSETTIQDLIKQFDAEKEEREEEEGRSITGKTRTERMRERLQLEIPTVTAQATGKE